MLNYQRVPNAKELLNHQPVTWLVVSTIWFLFSISYMGLWDVILPIDELHHFSRWFFKPPTSHCHCQLFHQLGTLCRRCWTIWLDEHPFSSYFGAPRYQDFSQYILYSYITHYFPLFPMINTIWIHMVPINDLVESLSHPLPNICACLGRLDPQCCGETTLWIQKAIENGHRNSGFSHEKWWFSIVVGQFTRNYTFAPWKIFHHAFLGLWSHILLVLSPFVVTSELQPHFDGYPLVIKHGLLEIHHLVRSCCELNREFIVDFSHDFPICSYICLPSFLTFSPYPYFFSHFSHIWWLKMGWSKAPSPGTVTFWLLPWHHQGRHHSSKHGAVFAEWGGFFPMVFTGGGY